MPWWVRQYLDMWHRMKIIIELRRKVRRFDISILWSFKALTINSIPNMSQATNEYKLERAKRWCKEVMSTTLMGVDQNNYIGLSSNLHRRPKWSKRSIEISEIYNVMKTYISEKLILKTKRWVELEFFIQNKPERVRIQWRARYEVQKKSEADGIRAFAYQFIRK